MNNDNTTTDLLILVDSSASMGHLRSIVVDELNRLVDRMAGRLAAATVTIAAFDSTDPLRVVRDGVDAHHFLPVLPNEYRIGAGTPLLDGIGRLVRRATERAQAEHDAGRRVDTVVAVLTDGEENASTRYDLATIAGKLARRRAAGWRLLYLGPGDAVREGTLIGFRPDEISPWDATEAGTAIAFRTIADRTAAPRRERHR
jgi:hypothetical protein